MVFVLCLIFKLLLIFVVETHIGMCLPICFIGGSCTINLQIFYCPSWEAYSSLIFISHMISFLINCIYYTNDSIAVVSSPLAMQALLYPSCCSTSSSLCLISSVGMSFCPSCLVVFKFFQRISYFLCHCRFKNCIVSRIYTFKILHWRIWVSMVNNKSLQQHLLWNNAEINSSK